MRSDDSALSIEEMVSALRADPVLVHTMLGGGDTAAAEARIEAALEELDHPTYVAVVKHPDELQVGEDAESLAVHLADELGDGLYVVLTDDGGHGVVAKGVALEATTLSLAAYDSYERIEAEHAPVSDDGFTSLLSPTARRVHSARERNLRSRADAEVLALGEAIDATEMGAGAEQAWQQALDHYDAARRVRDNGTGIADAVGALVLAERGRQALAAAERHAGFHPEPTCYFDPLHRQGGRRVRWSHGATAVQVPACSQCRDALDQGRRPAVLELVSDGQSRPWYESDSEPWVSTGYGALDTDLVGALTRHRGRRA